MPINDATSTYLDIGHLREWIGKEQVKSDVITPRMVETFNSIFNVAEKAGNGGEAPAGIQWCLATDVAPMNEIGSDGHPKRGGFLPPIPLPRRMWAGGCLNYFGNFHIGDEVIRRSAIDNVVLKAGRTGALVFVTVRHEYRARQIIILNERQDLVYRTQDPGGSLPKPTVPSELLPVPDQTRWVESSPTLLFRYSAVTFNSHRIHYDLPYAMKEENYPGLIVHGPLQATFLLRMSIARLAGAFPSEFSFRSTRPLFAGPQFSLNAVTEDGRQRLWAADQAGMMTMEAVAIR